MVKRIMGLILTGTMIMSLLACGKADTDTAKTTQSDSNSSISSSSEDASNSEGDVITFTFAEHVADIENQAPQVYAVVQEFMKQNPDIKIEMTGLHRMSTPRKSSWHPSPTACRIFFTH